MNRRATALISGLLIALTAGSALACGESLFRVGKGVAYRQYTAPLPGNILAIANTEAELLMIEQLVAAGHDVHVVSSPGELGSELGEHEFDVILAYYSQRDEVTRQTASTTTATYIPVAMSDTTEEDEARSLYRRSLSSDDSVKTFLRTIHKTLKARG